MSLSKRLICRNSAVGLLLSLCLLSPGNLAAQQLSAQAKVSVLTCGQGKELYALFGHTAIRVVDPVSGIDRVYNYGTFDPKQPFFYWRFLMGKLEYELTVTNFSQFFQEYSSAGRSIREQELHFPPGLLSRIYDSLEVNALPRNRGYTYDFFEDNCTTRAIGLIYKLADDARFDDFFGHTTNLTYRKELRPYTRQSPWLLVGIDLLLGRYADAQITNYQSCFLPANLMNGLAKTDWTGEPEILYEGSSHTGKASGIFDPMVVLWLLAVLLASEILLMKTCRRTSARVDMVIFTLTGFLGLLFLSLRIFSEHPALQSNMNILWANPLNLLFVLFLFKDRKRAAKIYTVFYAAVLSFMLVTWNRIPQQVPLEIMPVLFLLAFRSLQRIFVFVEKPEKTISQ